MGAQSPQTTRPSLQFTGAAASAPQSTGHVTPAAHVTEQPPSHLTSHEDPASQTTVLRAPMLSLQLALPLHVAVESAPALSSHFAEPSQTMTL
jgi:hypothetical protein